MKTECSHVIDGKPIALKANLEFHGNYKAEVEICNFCLSAILAVPIVKLMISNSLPGLLEVHKNASKNNGKMSFL
jgi:hypothetical protein